jgi:hypothetical protein
MSRGAPALLCLVCLVCLLVACGSGSSPGAAEGKRVEAAFDCTVTLTRAQAVVYTGSGSDAEPAAAREAAWVDACGKLPEIMRPVCRDPGKFAAAEELRPDTSGAAAGHTVALTLTQIGAPLVGKAELRPTQADACQDALMRACTLTGTPGDCVASGAYVKASELAEPKQRVVSPPE